MDVPPDERRSAPSALRNRDPILEVLRRILPPTGQVLEIASGTGEHVIYFARHLPSLIWQPSDPSTEARASITAWLEAERPPNIRAPVDLDASSLLWPIEQAGAVIAINLVHISPWSVMLGLAQGAGRSLPRGGVLFLYGPYRRTGYPFAPSNKAFDADLRSRNPEWGIRDLDEVATACEAAGLRLADVIEMPANNLSLVFAKL